MFETPPRHTCNNCWSVLRVFLRPIYMNLTNSYSPKDVGKYYTYFPVTQLRRCNQLLNRNSLSPAHPSIHWKWNANMYVCFVVQFVLISAQFGASYDYKLAFIRTGAVLNNVSRKHFLEVLFNITIPTWRNTFEKNYGWRYLCRFTCYKSIVLPEYRTQL